jgi:thiol-disulfide isomerase/thioredoxin
MTKRPARRATPSRPTASRRSSGRVLAVVLGALALVAVVGIAIAIANEDPADDRPAFGPVRVEGTALPQLSGGTDQAVGQPVPRVEGVDPDGNRTTLSGGEPMLVAFLAHWCPHCNAELPVLVDLTEDGTFDGVRMVAVLTDSRRGAPNYPPARWLDRAGWTGDVLLDDERLTAASAYGVTGYPFIVAVGADGEVVARTSGEVPASTLAALADAARGG